MSGCGCGCGSAKVDKASAGDKGKAILEALVKIGGPCGTKEIVESTGLDAERRSRRRTPVSA